MIVCHRYRLIFVHLHKTGGTSVKEALQPHLSEGDVAIGVGRQGQKPADEVDGLSSRLSKHSNARQMSEVLGPEIWNSYFKFSLVRHPLDRIVSLYEFFRRVRRNNTTSPSFLKRMFALGRSIHPKEDPSQAPWSWPGMQALLTTSDFSGFIRSEYLLKDQGAQPQARSLTDRSGKLLVDFVGKVESISEDWEKICDQIGIRAELPHANRSQRRYEDGERYWTEENVRFATERHREDFELFGYRPDDFHR